MNIGKGRAAKYNEFIREFFEDGRRSPEHVLAYNESCEIMNIYDLWEKHIENFPGLEQKIRRVFVKGPIIREDERPDTSTNRPRNDAFVHLLAGKLIRAGIKVIAVDGLVARGAACHKDGDITFNWEGSVIDVQCKRPQSKESLDKRVREARRQLTKPSRQGRMGIIAIDCSALIRPLNNILEADSAELASRIIEERVERIVIPEVIRHFDDTIIGAFLFARVPTETRVGESPILSSNGKLIQYMRPDSVSTLLGRYNPANPVFRPLLRAICERINESYETYV